MSPNSCIMYRMIRYKKKNKLRTISCWSWRSNSHFLIQTCRFFFDAVPFALHMVQKYRSCCVYECFPLFSFLFFSHYVCPFRRVRRCIYFLCMYACIYLCVHGEEKKTKQKNSGVFQAYLTPMKSHLRRKMLIIFLVN